MPSSVVFTGASGFIGSALAMRLETRGTRLLRVGRGELGNAQRTIERFIDQYDGLVHLVHLAALSDTRACAANPELTRRVNVDLLADLLRVAAETRIGCVIFPSSGLVYSEQNPMPVDEMGAVDSSDPYRAAKLEGEALVKTWAEQNGRRARVLRLANAYGPGMSTGTVISDLLQQLPQISGRPLREIELHDAGVVRDFVFIDDVVEAFVRILDADSGPTSAIYNVGSGVGHTIGAVAEQLCKIARIEAPIMSRVPSSRPSRLILAPDKLFSRTSWTAATPLARGLEATCRHALKERGSLSLGDRQPLA